MRVFFSLLSFTLWALASGGALAAPSKEVCSDQPQALAKHAGVYASKQLLQSVRATRRWDKGSPDAAGLTELRISPAGEVSLSFSWHESGSLGVDFGPGCLLFDDKEVHLRHSQFKGSQPFERVEASTATYAPLAAPYFDLLFSGCFSDGAAQRWCFRTGTVSISGKTRFATLQLDGSELPSGGSVLRIQGENDLWLFVPSAKDWRVYRTTWASSATYAEPLWARPWKILTPAE